MKMRTERRVNDSLFFAMGIVGGDLMYKEILTKMYIEAYKRLKINDMSFLCATCLLQFGVSLFEDDPYCMCRYGCPYNDSRKGYNNALNDMIKFNRYLTVQYYTGRQSGEIAYYVFL